MPPFSRSPSRERYRSRTRSPTPRVVESRSPGPYRYAAGDSRSPTPPPPPPHARRNGRPRSESRSWSRERGRYGQKSSSPPGSMGTKIVVERLSKNVREPHLYEIFGQYGQIQDLDLPMNRAYDTNRGTAYILYEYRADAEEAIASMHEGQIDGATINVSIVLPRRLLSPKPPLARRGANIDPRTSLSAPRGGRGSYNTHMAGGGFGFRGGRRQYSPGRYGPPPNALRPSSRSLSRSRSPPRGPRYSGAGGIGVGGGGYRSRSYGSVSSRSRSKSPLRQGASSRYGDELRRRSRSRSYDTYASRRQPASPRDDYR